MRNKAESLGVLSSTTQKDSDGDGHNGKRKLKAPDADTMLVKMPAKEHSGSIGPIWNDAPSTSKDSQVQQYRGLLLPAGKMVVVLMRSSSSSHAQQVMKACACMRMDGHIRGRLLSMASLKGCCRIAHPLDFPTSMPQD